MDGNSGISVKDRTAARNVTPEQFLKFERYAGEIFSAFGMDLDTDSTRDTPRRFIKALYDITEGYEGDEKILKSFDTECRSVGECTSNQVIQGPIPFFSLCEHHALPFFGRAYVGYILRILSDFKAHSNSPVFSNGLRPEN